MRSNLWNEVNNLHGGYIRSQKSEKEVSGAAGESTQGPQCLRVPILAWEWVTQLCPFMSTFGGGHGIWAGSIFFETNYL